MSNILIYGVGSFKNRGCEALVKSSIYQIPQTNKITVATYDFDYNKKKYLDRVNNYINHYDNDIDNFNEKTKKKYEQLNDEEFDFNKYELLYQRDVVKEIKKNDICIHIGGDNYCYGASEWLYALNTEAHKQGKKTVLWGASLYDEINDPQLISNLQKYNLLILREKTSYNAIKKYVDEKKMLLVPDSAFSLKPEKVELDSWYKNRKVIGLNLSPIIVTDEKIYDSICDFIDYILSETNFSISLIPHVTTPACNDEDVLNKIKEKYNNEERIYLEKSNYDCSEIKYIISKCDYMIAARTHASIAAYSSIVPTLVLGYSVKSRGIAEDLFGTYKKYVISKDDINSEQLIDCFNYIIKNNKIIKETLNKKIKTYISEASSIYKKMEERLTELEQQSVCERNKCAGCTACVAACPVNAISMKEDNEGFKYPVIDLKKCIHCNKCKKVCPSLNNKSNKEIIKCYAAKSKEDDIRNNSSSGGIFSHLSKEILDNNGIVYGAMLDNFRVEHIRIDNYEDMYKIRGSKYAQSDLTDILKRVKKDLDDGKKVLFSGTPCQINGLKNYLGKEYENLIIISVVCHGVINNKTVNKRIKEFEETFDCKCKGIVFKSKKNGWSKSSIQYLSDKIDKTYYFNDDSMMNLFVNNYILRESCYNCSSKNDNNCADIIIGDYWGIEINHKDFYDEKGVSSIIIKTQKGLELFNKIKKKIDSIETNYREISKYNPCIDISVVRPDYRGKIFKDMEDNKLSIIVNAISGTSCGTSSQNISEVRKSLEKTTKDYNDLVEENKRIYSSLVETQDKLNSIYNSRSYKYINRIVSKLRKKDR